MYRFDTSMNHTMPTTIPGGDNSNHSADLVLEEELNQSNLRTPLLDGGGGGGNHHNEEVDGVRQRGTFNLSIPSRDIEQLQQEQQQQRQPRTPSSSAGRARRRILDRSGNFRQSRGRWGVDRQTTRRGDDSATTPWYGCFLFQRMHREWGKDWFFWLAYQKTFVLFLLLFVSYGLIIVFFGFIYLVSCGE
jgi:hypothetical protein